LLAGFVYGQENDPAEQARSASWQRYTVKGEDFSIKFPTLPAMTTYKQSGWGFQRNRWERHLGAYADGVVYTIFSLDDGDPSGALKAFNKNLVSSSASDGTTEQYLSLNGFSGKQYFWSNPLEGTMQVFATKNRFYRVRAVGAKAADPRVKQFFSSLSLGKKGEGIEVSDGQGIPFDPTDQPDPTGRSLTGREVERKAILIMKPQPVYTEEAREKEITGTVVLKVVFSSNGSVVNIRTASALPHGLTERAIDAARKIKFIPATIAERQVSIFIKRKYGFQFVLKGRLIRLNFAALNFATTASSIFYQK